VEVLLGEDEVLECFAGRADHLFGALAGGGEDDVADLAIFASQAAAVIQFFEKDGLAIRVVVADCLGFRLALSGEFGQVGRRLIGGILCGCD